jgi:hypothetical protein
VGHSTRDYAQARQIVAAGPGGMQALAQSDGTNHFDAKLAATFDAYFRKYFEHWNTYGGKPLTFGLLSPPHHVYAWSDGQKFTGQEQVRAVRVRFVEAYYDGEKTVTLSNDVVREVAIDTHHAETTPAAALEVTHLTP